MSLFLGDGVFVGGLSGFTTRPEARQNGFGWVAAILTHDSAAAANESEIRDRGVVYRAEGWKLCGWGTYGQSATPEDDARLAAQQVRALGLDGWIANGEEWAEGDHIDYSRRFLDTWAAEQLPVPLAVSCLSTRTDLFVRRFDYQAWVARGMVIMPQVYGSADPALTVGACLGMLARAGVPQRLLNLTYSSYTVDPPHPLPTADYQGWGGPRGVYLGESTAASAWSSLSRAAARPGSPPTPEVPVPPVKPLTPAQFPYTGPYYGPADLRGPSKGPTAKALKRAMSRLGYIPWRPFDEHYNRELQGAMSDWEISVGLQGTGQYGKGAWEKIRAQTVPDGPHKGELALDGPARKLVRDEAAKPVPPSLIEPRQGYDSLVKDLWEPYSIGARLGLVDLGTYNPASTLPTSGRPSDHATSRIDGRIGEPACAFDMGISPHNGYDNPVGRLFFNEMASGRWPVAYVILGTKIWNPTDGIHDYTAGGHENHVHTSGHRR